MGDHLLGENVSNPRGHFENLEFIKLNEELLNEYGGSWKNPPKISKLNFSKDKRNKINDFIKINQRPVWGLKDPRFMLTFPLWKEPLEQFAKVTYIFVHRPFFESVYSLSHRDRISIRKSEKILKPYLRNKNTFRKQLETEQADLIDVTFLELLSQPEEFVSKINRRLGLKENANLEKVRCFIDKRLKKF